MRSQPKKPKTPRKLRLTRSIGRALNDALPHQRHLLAQSMLPSSQWAQAAEQGSDVRIWPEKDGFGIQVLGVKRWVDKLTVRAFRRLVVRAINTPNLPETTHKALCHRRNILDEWLGLGVIDRLADVTL